jgi:hypothetical protein
MKPETGVALKGADTVYKQVANAHEVFARIGFEVGGRRCGPTV